MELAGQQQIVEQLQTEQHVRPHQTVAEALERARAVIGFCPDAARHALERLELAAGQKIGRLRRTELLQLSRCLMRAWTAATQSHPLPA